MTFYPRLQAALWRVAALTKACLEMASPDRLTDLREKARRIYALSFWGVPVPAPLHILDVRLRNVLDLLTTVQKIFAQNGTAQTDADEVYENVLVGLSEVLDGFQGALSRWIDDPRKLEETRSRQRRQHMIESLPENEVIQRTQDTLSLYGYILDKLVVNSRWVLAITRYSGLSNTNRLLRWL